MLWPLRPRSPRQLQTGLRAFSSNEFCRLLMPSCRGVSRSQPSPRLIVSLALTRRSFCAKTPSAAASGRIVEAWSISRRPFRFGGPPVCHVPAAIAFRPCHFAIQHGVFSLYWNLLPIPTPSVYNYLGHIQSPFNSLSPLPLAKCCKLGLE